MKKIENRKAKYEYEFLETYQCGMVLQGSEVKSLSEGNANITEAFIYIQNGEAYVKNMYIAKYSQASYNNHEERNERKLLLNKSEIERISNIVKDKGITIVPLEVYRNNGKFKMKIAVAKGKKDFDKRNAIKERDQKRDYDRTQGG